MQQDSSWQSYPLDPKIDPSASISCCLISLDSYRHIVASTRDTI